VFGNRLGAPIDACAWWTHLDGTGWQASEALTSSVSIPSSYAIATALSIQAADQGRLRFAVALYEHCQGVVAVGCCGGTFKWRERLDRDSPPSAISS
jgi:hypothetical protein